MAVNTKIPLTNTADGYLCEGTDIRGGYFVIDKLENIPSTITKIGSLCFCQKDTKFYQYDGIEWKLKKFESEYKLAAENGTEISAVTTGEKYTWNNKIDKNTAITAATKCKITYDSDGLVTKGEDLTASDIPNLDAAKITSGTFTDVRIASASNWNAKYDKPASGIPASDLADLAANKVTAMTGYNKPAATSAITTTDSLNTAIGKLETALDNLNIADATQEVSGLMSAADKKKLDEIAEKAEVNIQSDWNATTGGAQILNKPYLATVATSGSYNDLSDKPTIPSVSNATITVKQTGKEDQTFTLNGSDTTISLNDTIPTVNDGTLTIKTAGTSKGTFTANQSGNTEINITAADLGLSGAMKFIGSTTTEISDGTTSNVIAINNGSETDTITAENGNVVLSNNKEFIWNGTIWEELGDESSHALKSIAITGTGVLSGGGTLEKNRTVTHNEVLGTAKTDSKIYKTKIDKYGHISEATAVTKDDITTLGIPPQDTTYDVATTTTLGLVKSSTTGIEPDRDYVVEVNEDGTMKVNIPWTDTHNSHTIISGKKADGTTEIKGSGSDSDITLGDSGVTAGTYKRVTVNAKGIVVGGDQADADTNTWRKIQLDGTDKLTDNTDTNPLNIKAGNNMTITESSGTFTFTAEDTKYEAATDSTLGLVRIGYTENDKNYPVELNTNNQMYVNVPWSWRGIQNNLTSTSISDSLSAAQGKVLNDKFANYLPIDGSIAMTGQLTAPSFYANSDRRLKENIKEFIPQKSILDLPIVEFDFKNSNIHEIGCIAQDLQEICPEVVKTDINGYLSISEIKLVYLLLDEVKKLKSELNNRIAAIEEQLNK